MRGAPSATPRGYAGGRPCSRAATERSQVIAPRWASARWGRTPSVPSTSPSSAGAFGDRGIRVHEVTAVHRHDVSKLRGIWVSSPARALLEVAAELSPDELAEAVERAQVKRSVTKRQLKAVLVRAGGRPG